MQDNELNYKLSPDARYRDTKSYINTLLLQMSALEARLEITEFQLNFAMTILELHNVALEASGNALENIATRLGAIEKNIDTLAAELAAAGGKLIVRS